jgi:hypothetical protein
VVRKIAIRYLAIEFSAALLALGVTVPGLSIAILLELHRPLWALGGGIASTLAVVWLESKSWEIPKELWRIA